VIDTSNERLAGTIGFHTVSDLNRNAEIAYDLAPAYWGRGLAARLCERVTRWGFDSLGFIRVQATVLCGNARSDRVLLKCGFRHEGLLRSYRLVRGTPGDFNLYARLATD
jgi:RimJ/RimL family protein N-acetyltransferase